MDDVVFHKVQDFIEQFTKVKKDRLTADTTLFHGLGIDGADAWELMAAFAAEFKVDMTDFALKKHFGPEGGFNPFYYLYCLVFDRRRLHRIPVSLCDLTEAAKNKKWPKK